MAVQIQLRNDTAAAWAAANPVLAQGEMGLESNTSLFKIGDGVTAWGTLPYGGLIGPEGPKGDDGATGAAGATGATGPQGESGVASATAPIVYNALTKDISLNYNQLIIDGGTA
jgi:hypothetical protein